MGVIDEFGLFEINGNDFDRLIRAYRANNWFIWTLLIILQPNKQHNIKFYGNFSTIF